MIALLMFGSLANIWQTCTSTPGTLLCSTHAALAMPSEHVLLPTVLLQGWRVAGTVCTAMVVLPSRTRTGPLMLVSLELCVQCACDIAVWFWQICIR